MSANTDEIRRQLVESAHVQAGSSLSSWAYPTRIGEGPQPKLQAKYLERKTKSESEYDLSRHRAFTNSTRAVATGNTASINTGSRSTPSAKYSKKCASFISTPLSIT
jgi:hypothetical protein